MSIIRSCPTRVMLAVSIGWISVGSLHAQGASEVCRALSDVTVGQWAEYRFIAANSEESITLYSAIVGTEDVGGIPHYWHESKMVGEDGKRIIQILVPGYPFDVAEIQRSVMKMGDEPAIEISDRMLGMMRGQGMGEDPVKDAAEQCDELTEIGRESVTVPAGTFETVHLRYGDGAAGDIWVASGVPFGMVKAALPDREEILLVDHGTDATSSITETPQRMPGMP